MDMCWQAFALSSELLNQGGVVFLYKLLEQSMLWVTAFLDGVTKGSVARENLKWSRLWLYASRSSLTWGL